MKKPLTTLIEYLKGLNKICILGFGREGQSTWKFLSLITNPNSIFIHDGNQKLLLSVGKEMDILKKNVILGENYLRGLEQYDLIIKSPGISLKNYPEFPLDRTCSQTALFLQFFGSQTIGITGTKGKSTTSSLIYHLLKDYISDTRLCGNMGIPLFDNLEKVTPQTRFVVEFSSHQLQYINSSPKTGILLNLFEEHLDHYKDKEEYFQAKLNIAKYQNRDGHFLFDKSDPITLKQLEDFETAGKKLNIPPFSEMRFSNKDKECIQLPPSLPLPGNHNKKNILFALMACRLEGIPIEYLLEKLQTFQPLPHRLEEIGKFQGITFINDSISTIPEATIAAINCLDNISALIIGGMDRGINYSALVSELKKGKIPMVLAMGEAGKRIIDELADTKAQIFYSDELEKLVDIAFEHCPNETICLLSPAAASYGYFKNFEERGLKFRKFVEVREA